MESVSIGWQTLLVMLGTLGGISHTLLFEKMFPTTRDRSVLEKGVILVVGLVVAFGGIGGIFYFFGSSIFMTLLMVLLEACGVSLILSLWLNPKRILK